MAVAGRELGQPPRREHHRLAVGDVAQFGEHQLLGVADGADLVGRRRHRRAAVENVDIAVIGEAFALEHPHRRAARRVGDAHHRARAFGQHRGVDRRLGHQIGDELGAVLGVELVGLLEIHAEEAARDRVPEGRSAGLVDHAAQLGEDAVAEALAVLADEQIAAAREQQAEPAGALAGVEEQPADLGRSLEIGAEIEHLVAEGLAQLLRGLGEAADRVGIEGAFGADLAEHLAGAADLAVSAFSSTSTNRSSPWHLALAT